MIFARGYLDSSNIGRHYNYNEDGSEDYKRWFEHLVFYWRVENASLKKPIELFVALKDNF